eukprot:CAMPEP_0196134958 /NCGR_PEP_ID=MMETSP0910-20130528/3749_1 /TAXON_ID=49265 /ORGANISM="Thalassiosira rotula, Strain GSO102" /LENGTH=560 /DNA_ID=CAMNT_0041395019 /DNA_START=62 /DNA_END=1744 /DNA_ORIENTATION=-
MIINDSCFHPAATISQELLPILSHALPSVISYTLPSERVVQGNAEGSRIVARHSSSSTPSEGTLDAIEDAITRGKGDDDPRLPVTAAREEGRENDNNSSETIEETELFLKRVAASSYAHKSWTDMRRTLVYLRTEVRFYNEIAPLLLAANDGSNNHDDDDDDDDEDDVATRTTTLRNHLPVVHHADYDLTGLIPEDCPTTDAEQASPFLKNNGGDNNNNDDAIDDGNDMELRKNRLLQNKGGHILLQSLSPSHGYFQDSPLSPFQSSKCLAAVAELHASAWGDEVLLRTIGDRLSTAGGSYQLSFRNPRELRELVESWDGFRARFATIGGGGGEGDVVVVDILEKESVVRLGRRVYDMAEYVSKELTPEAGDEYATMVHGDYKAMNVFLPSESTREGNKDAIMIDFSCAGIGYGMSDVGMHIVHAVLPRDLDNGGEERLVEGYLVALENAVNRRRRRRRSKRIDDDYDGEGKEEEEERWTYPREVAMRHYRLACVDYLRFIMGRFWRSATPESFEKKSESKNTTLINRNLEAAMAFIAKVDRYLEVFEKEKREREMMMMH